MNDYFLEGKERKYALNDQDRDQLEKYCAIREAFIQAAHEINYSKNNEHLGKLNALSLGIEILTDSDVDIKFVYKLKEMLASDVNHELSLKRLNAFATQYARLARTLLNRSN